MSTDPSYVTAFAQGLESVINAALKYDPGTRRNLTKINGKVLAVDCRQPELTFYFQAIDEQLQVLAHYEDEPTTKIEGKLFSLFHLMQNPGHSLADSGVTVSGQVALLSDYQQILKNLEIDWEDALSSLMGDLPAHQIAQLARGAFNWFQPKGQRLPQFLAEFLTEELRAIPAKSEIEHFSRNVSLLRQQTDRLDARVQKLLAEQQSQQ
ncbi:ubiquinone biosynthesis accessory factor UbiJ [Teredinibacter haidensis]|uniref:ubiquinone biosynthesis accessory factor UbiJ n=1 Tax=Teredinibacter haidensis TaxID=2731755 RepID=UPI000948C4E0|nr:SCP2 sterol-binding domain-containing protein [Teredinibacter haidensis]